MVFEDAEVFRKVVAEYAVEYKVQLKLRPNDSRRVRVKAKMRVIRKFMGDWKEEFSILCNYGKMIKQTNPGSSCWIRTDRETEPGKNLKNDNQQIYPIAWAVVDTKIKHSWSWFIDHLITDIEDLYQVLVTCSLVLNTKYVPGTFGQIGLRSGNEREEENNFGDVQSHHLRFWILRGIPCHHAACAYRYINEKLEERVEKWYRKDYFLMAYKYVIQPIPNMNMWPATSNIKIEPPTPKVMPGRPKSYRRKFKDEPKKKWGKWSKKGVKITCSKCQQQGHNKTHCPGVAGEYGGGTLAIGRCRGMRRGTTAEGRGRGIGRGTTAGRKGSGIGRGTTIGMKRVKESASEDG
ncbi:uncharacterized protein [Nicotiana tomentosiformis]|uniref:uncharacterized protein n=1 Tax=Nicotiana tomentosiformis TaxID=4098 RepID=UPI00388CDD81